MEYKRTKTYTQEFVDNHTCDFRSSNKRFQYLDGKVFTDLTVLKMFKREDPHTYWFCKCKCGIIVSKTTAQLNSGRHKMCTACSFKEYGNRCKIDVQERFELIQKEGMDYLDLLSTKEKLWKFYCTKCSTEFRDSPSQMIRSCYKGTPCRCDNGVKFTQWTTEMREVQVKERCQELNLTFLGWMDKEGYKKNTSRVILKCNKHKPYDISINNFVGDVRYGCPHCADEIKGVHLKYDLNKFITEARKVHGDKFDYSEYKYICSRTPSRITCKHCNLPFNASYDNHVNKGRGCPHEKGKTHLFTYLLCIKDNNIPIGIKLGKATKYETRIEEHIKGNAHFSIETIGVWEYVDTDWCNKSESRAKRELPCNYLSNKEFLTGSSETLSVEHINSVIKIYEDTGGTRIV